MDTKSFCRVDFIDEQHKGLFEKLVNCLRLVKREKERIHASDA